MGRMFYLPYDNGIRILGFYPRNLGVVTATPPGTDHICHATYLNRAGAIDTNRCNIDYFLVRSDAKEEELFGKDHKIIHSKKIPKHMLRRGDKPSIEERYGMRWQIVNEFRSLEPVIKKVGIVDVHDHMLGKKDPSITSDIRTEYVDSIESTAGITEKNTLEIDPGGKQTFYPSCILDINIDFSRWCMSEITPDGKVMPWGACIYCYAGFKHAGYPYVFTATKDQLVEQIKRIRAEREKQGLETRYIRLGKKVETGVDMFREQRMILYEACLETGLSCVFPTKFLSFDIEEAEMLKRTDSSLLISLGKNEFEPGACLHGKTNNWRLEQGLLYQDDGVRVVPYVLVDAVKEDGGEHFADNLRKAEGLFDRMQILPVRIRHRGPGERILGGWNDILGEYRENDINGSTGGYEKSRDHTRLAVHIHPSLADRVGDNTGDCRMCHHNSHLTWCGKCFMGKEKGEIIDTPEVNVEIKFKRPKKGKRPRYTGNELFDMDADEIKNGKSKA